MVADLFGCDSYSECPLSSTRSGRLRMIVAQVGDFWEVGDPVPQMGLTVMAVVDNDKLLCTRVRLDDRMPRLTFIGCSRPTCKLSSHTALPRDKQTTNPLRCSHKPGPREYYAIPWCQSSPRQGVETLRLRLKGPFGTGPLCPVSRWSVLLVG